MSDGIEIPGTVDIGEHIIGRATTVTVVMPAEDEQLVSIIADIDLGEFGSSVCIEVDLAALLGALGVTR